MHHGSLKYQTRRTLELDAIKYQRLLGTWEKTTNDFKNSIRNYENSVLD